MSDKRLLLCQGGMATARKPRVVLVGGVGNARLAEQFRNLDWDVFNVPAGGGLACAVLARKPSAVLLPVETDFESGYLVAAKLRTAKRKVKVVLVGDARTPEAERFARFVGASLVSHADGVVRLMNAVTE